MLALQQVDNGRFDLVVDNSVDALVQTVVFAALFTDAENVNALDKFDRRGWWGGDVGTGLWWVRSQPLSDEVRADVVDMVFDALVHHGFDNVQVLDVSGSNNVSSLILQLSGTYTGYNFLVTQAL